MQCNKEKMLLPVRSCPSCNLTIIYSYQGKQIQVDTALDLIKGLEKYHLFVETSLSNAGNIGRCFILSCE